MKLLCRIGLHSWCTFKVGTSTIAGFMTETPTSEVCRRCGETRNYSSITLGSVPSLSKDSGMWKKYREKRGDGYVTG